MKNEKGKMKNKSENGTRTQILILTACLVMFPAFSAITQAKQEKFSLSFGYSLFAPGHVKFSNKGLEGRISYALSKKSDLWLTLSYAEHTWNSVYPATAQEAELKAALWTANMTYFIPAFHRSSSRPLNDVYVTGGYAGISMTYEPNAALGLSSTKQNFSGYNMGIGAKFWKVFTAEYRFYIFPKRTLDFRSLEASNAEQFTFSLTPLSF